MTPWQQNKQQAYIVSYNYLVEIKRKKIEPGTSMADFMDLYPALKDLGLLQEFGSRRSVGPMATKTRHTSLTAA